MASSRATGSISVRSRDQPVDADKVTTAAELAGVYLLSRSPVCCECRQLRRAPRCHDPRSLRIVGHLRSLAALAPTSRSAIDPRAINDARASRK
jgi:hypothetical protein